MLKLEVENQIDDSDKSIVSALKDMIREYPNDNLNDIYRVLNICNFREHKIGRGGNHIWIKRKNDNLRIVVLTYKAPEV